jgi:hypothetical protein
MSDCSGTKGISIRVERPVKYSGIYCLEKQFLQFCAPH